MIDRLDNHLFFSRLVGGAMTQKWKGNPCSGYLGPDIQLAIMVPLKIMTVPHLGKGPHLLLAAQIEVLISIGGISMSRVKMSWHQLQSQRQVLLMYCNTFEKLHFTTFNLQKYVDATNQCWLWQEPFFKYYHTKSSQLSSRLCHLVWKCH